MQKSGRVAYKRGVRASLTTAAVLAALLCFQASAFCEPPHGLPPSRAQQEKVIAALKAHRDRVNKYDANGSTPLMSAADDGSLLVVKYLLDHGARVDIRDGDRPEDERNTALGHAVKSGNLVIAEELLRRGAKLNGETTGFTLTSDMSLPVPLLSGAARGNDPALVKWLAKHGANMDTMNDHYESALFYAADPTMVKTLIACGAHLNPRHRGDASVLDRALASTFSDIGPNFYVTDDIIAAYLEAGAIDSEAMSLAVARVTTVPLHKMLRMGWNPNRRNRSGLTPLMVAASDLRPDVILLLLQYKAKVNLRTDWGGTALSMARNSDGHRERDYSRLSEFGNGYPPANEKSRQEVIRLLKAAGAKA
jgi:ankyrin repeat protein